MLIRPDQLDHHEVRAWRYGGSAPTLIIISWARERYRLTRCLDVDRRDNLGVISITPEMTLEQTSFKVIGVYRPVVMLGMGSEEMSSEVMGLIKSLRPLRVEGDPSFGFYYETQSIRVQESGWFSNWFPLKARGFGRIY